MAAKTLDKQHRLLVIIAIVMVVGWVSWTLYDSSSWTEQQPGDSEYLQGNRAFEDAHYQDALDNYIAALRVAPHHQQALRGKALSLMQLDEEQAALQTFNALIATKPVHPASAYANRGILYDRMGLYEKALADYQQALALDTEMAEGPGWMTRFFRLQVERPPTIADRAAYLQQELAKPTEQRVLKKPEEDEKQRPYKQG